MGNPSTRKDGFGTGGIEDNGSDATGTRGHSSQGGTANDHTGGVRGKQHGPGNQANKQIVENAGNIAPNAPKRPGGKDSG